MKRLFCAMLTVWFVFGGVFSLGVFASDGVEGESTKPTEAPDYGFTLDAASAILMEASTGTVLYEQNADEALAPASVTKIMTLLLVMEAVSDDSISLDQRVPVSEYAASMGGSQVFLEAGEEMTLEEMIKCTVIASANDAAVALAELVCGSEEAFVSRMNERAKELGMKNTHFENVTGLDDTTVRHETSARDIAIMSQALIAHPLILKYSGIWTDVIRNGEFTLTNTNRLIRYYDGATGLKTGSTAKAKFCISATAERGGMTLIAVIMGAPTRDSRNDSARRLLDFGFANYALFSVGEDHEGKMRVLGGASDTCGITKSAFSAVVPKGELSKITVATELADAKSAPIAKGQELGRQIYRIGDRDLGSAPILASESVERITFWKLLGRLVERILFS